MILSLTFLIFRFLELLVIKDTADRPRGEVRRGEIWANVAFHLSDEPIKMLCELERMSRGKTESVIFMKLYRDRQLSQNESQF